MQRIDIFREQFEYDNNRKNELVEKFAKDYARINKHYEKSRKTLAIALEILTVIHSDQLDELYDEVLREKPQFYDKDRIDILNEILRGLEGEKRDV
jgi:uncharacterized membrane-anchored protein YhcB (DUF1043 family)